MYFELSAPTQTAFHGAVWEAEMLGLDPEYDSSALTFNIGTGSIEKVTRLIDRHNLLLIKESDYEPNSIYTKGY